MGAKPLKIAGYRPSIEALEALKALKELGTPQDTSDLECEKLFGKLNILVKRVGTHGVEDVSKILDAIKRESNRPRNEINTKLLDRFCHYLYILCQRMSMDLIHTVEVGTLLFHASKDKSLLEVTRHSILDSLSYIIHYNYRGSVSMFGLEFLLEQFSKYDKFETYIRERLRLIHSYRYLSTTAEMTPPTPLTNESRYDGVAASLEGETRTFRQQVAATLLPALKDEMQRQPHGTYEQKVELVRWVNAELRRFDLAIKHPKTGLPAAFKAKPGNHPEIGTFQLISKDADDREKTFSTPELATLLDQLELMEAAPRREALAEWHEKVGKQPRGRRR